MGEAHNAYMAELDFGKDKMDKYQRSGAPRTVYVNHRPRFNSNSV